QRDVQLPSLPRIGRWSAGEPLARLHERQGRRPLARMRDLGDRDRRAARQYAESGMNTVVTVTVVTVISAAVPVRRGMSDATSRSVVANFSMALARSRSVFASVIDFRTDAYLAGFFRSVSMACTTKSSVSLFAVAGLAAAAFLAAGFLVVAFLVF